MVELLCIGTGLSLGALFRNGLLGLALAYEKTETLGTSMALWSIAIWSYVPLVLLLTGVAWSWSRRNDQIPSFLRKRLGLAGGLAFLLCILVSLVVLGWILIGYVVTHATGTGQASLEMDVILYTTLVGALTSPCCLALGRQLKRG